MASITLPISSDVCYIVFTVDVYIVLSKHFDDFSAIQTTGEWVCFGFVFKVHVDVCVLCMLS